MCSCDFEVNQTKIKGGCQSRRKVVPHDSKSDSRDIPVLTNMPCSKILHIGKLKAPRNVMTTCQLAHLRAFAQFEFSEFSILCSCFPYHSFKMHELLPM